MSDPNPYQPPKSSLERDFKVDGEMSFRDGGYLLARKGYTAPRVCVKTGRTVEEGVEPIKYYMRPEFTWKSWLFMILLFGTIGALVYFGSITYEKKINLYSAILMLAILPFGVIKRKKLPGIFVFCHEELTSEIHRNQKIYGSFMYGGMVIMNLGIHFEWHPSVTIIVVVLAIVGARKIPKPVLKSLGREGDYERFKGAHSNFLDALPTGFELETLSDLAENEA